MPVTEKDVRTALKAVKDPELGLDLVVLGLIYDIDINEAAVKATISLTSPFCPVAGQIVEDVKTAIEGVHAAHGCIAAELMVEEQRRGGQVILNRRHAADHSVLHGACK